MVIGQLVVLFSLIKIDSGRKRKLQNENYLIYRKHCICDDNSTQNKTETINTKCITNIKFFKNSTIGTRLLHKIQTKTTIVYILRSLCGICVEG